MVAALVITHLAACDATAKAPSPRRGRALLQRMQAAPRNSAHARGTARNASQPSESSRRPTRSTRPTRHPRLSEALEVETKGNALRHPFCPCHLALHRNSPPTAEVAGNSPTRPAKHSKGLLSRIAAEEWLAITSDTVRKFAEENGILLEW